MIRAFIVHIEVSETDNLQAIADAINLDLSDNYDVQQVNVWQAPSADGSQPPPPITFPAF